jgi:hypothetical protein
MNACAQETFTPFSRAAIRMDSTRRGKRDLVCRKSISGELRDSIGTLQANSGGKIATFWPIAKNR